VREQLDRLVSEMVARGIRLEDAVRELEKRFIDRALQTSEGGLGEVADRLGIHRNTLTRKIGEYGLRKRARE
jgi:DNA-binding NtrC family response regulator